MLSRLRFIALILVVFWVLVVLNLPSRTVTQLERAIGGSFLPLLGLAHAGEVLYEKGAHTLLSRQALLNQLEELRRENQALRLRAMQGEEALRENNRWRDLLAVQKQSAWNLKLARVVGRDPANWWRTLQIDRGSRDGVRANLPVLTVDGLVGRISEVSFNRSQVVLVGDPNCHVAGLVQETRDTTGIIVPSTADILDTRWVDLTYVSRTSALKPGQKVVTSGQGGIFPKGIPVGQIEETSSVEYGQYLEARVKLAVDLSRLEEVWVLMP